LINGLDSMKKVIARLILVWSVLLILFYLQLIGVSDAEAYVNTRTYGGAAIVLGIGFVVLEAMWWAVKVLFNKD